MDDIKDDYEGFKEAFDIFKLRLNIKGIAVTPKQETVLARDTLALYAEYQVINHVSARLHDPLKLFAWFPFFLIKTKYPNINLVTEDQKKDIKLILNTSISTLADQLHKEGYTIHDDWLNKLITLTYNGLTNSNESISIGKIGLYSSFKSASRTRMSALQTIKEILSNFWLLKFFLSMFGFKP